MESKQTRPQVLESSEHLDLILNETGFGVWDCQFSPDDTGSGGGGFPTCNEQLFLSDRCLEMAGYFPGDLGNTPREIFESWFQKTHPEDIGKISDMLEGVISGKTDKSECSFRIMKKDGGWKWLLLKGVVLSRDPVEKTITASGIQMDFDEVVNFKAENQKHQKRFRRIVEDAHIGILIAEGGIIRYVNDSVERMSGYTRSELIDMNIIDIVDDADKKMIMDRRSNRLKGYSSPSFYPVRARNKTGALRWVEVNSMPLDPGEHSTTLVFLRDVTLEKALEKRETHSQKIQAIGTLAGGIAHDFNNILTSIMGYAEMCMMELPAGNNASRRLGHIMTAARRASDLVRQILAFSHRDETDPKPVKLDLIVKEVVKFIRVSTPASITVLSDVSDTVGSVMADPTQLHQVVMNLCTNAVYAMRDRGGVLDVTLSECEMDESDPTVVARGLAPGTYLHLSISDTGHGMSPETLKNIFDPYFTTKPKGEGTGLGLSVASGIIAGFNGAINVCSMEGRGSAFHVYLPRHSDMGEAEEVEKQPIVGGDETILLVDDEAMLLELVRERLEGLGYTVVPCYNGIEAFQAFVDNPKRFDLVFSDNAMPGMSGLELARRIREVDSTIPFILCCGFSKDISPQSLADCAIGAVLSKPVLIHDISETIRRLLD